MSLRGRPLDDDGKIEFLRGFSWRHAALRVGEELAGVGPDGYYDLPPDRWRDWALAAIWHKNARIEALEKEVAELKQVFYRDAS